ELGGQHDLVPAAGDGLAVQFLVDERAVDVGRVEQRDAQVQGTVDGRGGLLVIPRAVELRHAHAAQALARYDQALTAECDGFCHQARLEHRTTAPGGPPG